MELNNKFNIDQKLFMIYFFSKAEKAVCDVCNGDGIIEIKGKRFTCPECNGNPDYMVEKTRKWHVINTSPHNHLISIEYNRVKKIDAIITEGGIRLMYYFGKSAEYAFIGFTEKDLFLTLQEAQEKCDKRNN